VSMSFKNFLARSYSTVNQKVKKAELIYWSIDKLSFYYQDGLFLVFTQEC